MICGIHEPWGTSFIFLDVLVQFLPPSVVLRMVELLPTQKPIFALGNCTELSALDVPLEILFQCAPASSDLRTIPPYPTAIQEIGDKMPNEISWAGGMLSDTSQEASMAWK